MILSVLHGADFLLDDCGFGSPAFHATSLSRGSRHLRRMIETFRGAAAGRSLFQIGTAQVLSFVGFPLD